MNEFTIGKRMITITIDEEMFQSLYNAILWSDEIEHGTDSETWKFMLKIDTELNG